MLLGIYFARMAFTLAQSGVVISAGLQKILLGSVSERVICQAQCSVLVV